MIKLGVNVDHVATIRQARRIDVPDPVHAASICELAGCDGITIHLREDRRHIQDRDVQVLRQTIKTRMNLEMAVADEIVDIAIKTKPYQSTLVPEKREEVTTEGGLDIIEGGRPLIEVIKRLNDSGIIVSLFIDPDPDQIEAAASSGAEFIELHTGKYADLKDPSAVEEEYERLFNGAALAIKSGLSVNAGHGLDYANVSRICTIPGLQELNIGHSIITRSVFTGIHEAVREMLKQMGR